MKEKIIISDFDGTITKKDTLYYFFKENASDDWTTVEELWKSRKIGSKECLIREFNLVKNLSENLIDKFIQTLELSEYFKEFIKLANKNKVDFVIVSDGIDYFINKVLKVNKIENVKLIANHAEFRGNDFIITCPYGSSECKVNSGTCKCKIINDYKKDYKEIVYIGDGTSDFCVADNIKTDKLFAKDGLSDYCEKKNIDHIKFDSFKDIANSIF